MPDFPAVGHVALTVSDLSVSRPWYQKLFGSDPVLDEVEDKGTFHHVVWMLNGTLFGIHEHKSPSSSDPCDELRPGIDHVSFHLASKADLDGWEKKLDELGIKHGGIVQASYGFGLSFRDPDNNPLEFFAPPG